MKIPPHFVERLKVAATTSLPYDDVPNDYGSNVRQYKAPAVVAWLTKTRTALEAAFPTGHAVLRDWADLTRNQNHRFVPHIKSHVENAQALVMAALEIVQEGDLESLAERVRAETVTELLDAAAEHEARGQLVAATVIAGGALETHIRHLCGRAGIDVAGVSGLAALDGSVAQARNAGNEIYSAMDGADIRAWGVKRNRAAHEPGTFDLKPVEVRLMIDAVRNFVSKTA